ncbi:hypothetical protein [Streptomyces sp. CAU 1734]|uniref:phage tail protein n=1 Tax=Streptomyces sp. CAU 1734 TaxID=3140360 RepID=UPI0032618915
MAGSHPPPSAEAAAAQEAARPPRDDAPAQGKAAQAERMNEARPREFDRDAFIRAVEKAIAEKAPRNLDEADRFADSGKADEVRAEVRGKAGEGRAESAGEITATTAAPPDLSAAVPKNVVPLTADRPPGAPPAPAPGNAVPERLPSSATDMSAGPADVNRRMAAGKVTEAQLKRSNEPAFAKALNEKKSLEAHSAAAPGRLRAGETNRLRAAAANAKALGTGAMRAMAAGRVTAGELVDTGKAGARDRDEERRAQVTAVLHGVFDTMKREVEGVLSGLDKLVDDQFDRGEKEAREWFTAEHRRRMDEYKDRRYSGAAGKLRWIGDLFTGLPAEADQIFTRARDGYLRRMRQVISDVATTVGAELGRAKRRIARGREELRDTVAKLPAGLRAIGREAAAEFTDRFAELTRSVDDKGTQLVDTLATRYTEALAAVDSEIAAEKEKNKGLIAKAAEAVMGVIETILELKRLLLAVLAKAAQAVLMILGDPVGFLRHLVAAVGAGLRQFLRNIGTHLRQGIMSWLLGQVSGAGIQLPAKFDAPGILGMIAGLLGLTWQNIRSRIARQVPEPAIAAAETAVQLIAEVRRRGFAALWEELKSRVGDLRKTLLDKVIEYVTPTIVMAGITWVLSLLNPASAFVRAVKLIIDIVTFVVTQARRIIDFVNAVLDSVIAIARGGGGGVPDLVERALARSVPVLLGFLASLLGIEGIAAKVKQIVQALAAPVNKAVDWVVDKLVGLVKKVWEKVKGLAGSAFGWIARKIKGKTVAKSFTMVSGEPHTLTAHPGDSALRVTIASAFAGEVRAVMGKVRAEADKLPEPDRAGALATIGRIDAQLARMKAAEAKWVSGKKAAEKDVARRIQTRRDKKKITTDEQAEALSKQWLAEKEQRLHRPIEQLLAAQIGELSRLTSMKQFTGTPGKRWIPAGYDVRTRLYVLGSGWQSKSRNWREKEKAALVKTVKAALEAPKPKGEAQLNRLDKKFKLPEGALDLFDKGKLRASHVETTAYEVDHSEPLAEHWHRRGRASDDTERRNHCVDESKWDLITKSHNASKQAGGFQYSRSPELGKSFTSSLADGGVKNAKRIDGRSLLDPPK